MKEILPNLFHWTTVHEKIGIEVSSYYLAEERILLDPMTPDEGIEWFAAHGPPSEIHLTNRHHYRHSAAYVEAYGCTVRCVREGMHEFKAGEQVEPFEFGDELPGGIVVHEVDAICPDETALHIPAHRALACADGVVRFEENGPLGFVPDFLIDEPEKTKANLIDAYGKLLELDFDCLLLAHGMPLVDDGKTALQEFVAAGSEGRT